MEAAELPATKPEGTLRLLTLNMAHGRRKMSNFAFRGRRSVERSVADIAHTFRQVSPDVVALQEADGPSAWSGNFDHVAKLADLAELDDHYRGDHHPIAMGERLRLAYGTALLARLPLTAPHSHSFDSNWRDTKGFVVATVAVPEWDGAEIDVVSVHLDFLVPTVRRRQIIDMVMALVDRKRPMAILGDLNCCLERESKSMDLLMRTLDLRAHEPDAEAPTYPSYRPRRRIDWILISKDLEFAAHHTLPLRLSDHLGVMADLRPR
jgi:endonuclease/exonuclease/phosphatase family metal-dependent hydrolase